jgi:hypothetical protein
MSKGVAILFSVFALGTYSLAAPPSQAQEKAFSFPYPVQWKAGDFEVSVIGVAWGPANSPEMISRGHEVSPREKPFASPDLSYALAIRLRASMPNPDWGMTASSSGLVLVRNANGDDQVAMQLTPQGFTHYSGSPGIYDMTFNRARTIEFWDFFPVSPIQKEFLFQSFQPQDDREVPATSFRVLVTDNGLDLVSLVPPSQGPCKDFNRSFSGTIGSHIAITMHLVGKSGALFGTEQYSPTGKSLTIGGNMDSFGNVVLQERYPRNHVTGIFNGKFSSACSSASGYFSKPDGTELLPFVIHHPTPDDSTRPEANP